MSLTCFIDTETSGLPIWKKNKDYFHFSENDAYDESRIVSVALIFTNADNQIIHQSYYIRNPEDEENIHWGGEHIHKISKEKALLEGIPFNLIIQKNLKFLMNSHTLVGHNVKFDFHIFLNEINRLKQFNHLTNHLAQISLFCTMESGKNITKIPAKNGHPGYSFPKLSILLKKITGEDLENAHNALDDCIACMKCYVAMNKL